VLEFEKKISFMFCKSLKDSTFTLQSLGLDFSNTEIVVVTRERERERERESVCLSVCLSVRELLRVVDRCWRDLEHNGSAEFQLCFTAAAVAGSGRERSEGFFGKLGRVCARRSGRRDGEPGKEEEEAGASGSEDDDGGGGWEEIIISWASH
jgi:hypothetical protein